MPQLKLTHPQATPEILSVGDVYSLIFRLIDAPDDERVTQFHIETFYNPLVSEPLDAKIHEAIGPPHRGFSIANPNKVTAYGWDSDSVPGVPGGDADLAVIRFRCIAPGETSHGFLTQTHLFHEWQTSIEHTKVNDTHPITVT